MDRLLQANLAEAAFHSSSEFTLDSLKARSKLAEFQLPEPGLWLAKLAQAALRSGASQFVVQFQRRRVCCWFDPQEALDARELLEEILSGRLYPDGLYYHLITAIRTSASALSESVQWAVGDSAVKLHPDGTDFFALPQRESGFRLEVGIPARERGLWKTLASPVSQLIRSTVEEDACLQQRCWYTPLQLTVDGRKVEPYLVQSRLWQEPDSLGAVAHKYGSYTRYYRCVLAARALELEGRPNLSCRPLPPPGRFHKRVGEVSLTYPTFLGGHFAVWDTPASTQAVCLITLQERAEVEIEFLLDGVKVDGLRWPLPPSKGAITKLVRFSMRPGLRLLVEVTPDDLDLSHFRMRNKSQKARQFLDLCLPKIQEVCEVLQSNLGDLFYLALSEKQALGLGLTFGGGLSLAALTVAPVILPIGALAVAGNVAINKPATRMSFGWALQVLFEAVKDGLPIAGEGT